MKKSMTEWDIDLPWGKVAMVSWGDPKNPPMLLAHGYMDTSATFIPLLDLLPNTYYYVAFDLPGHGKSDAYPPGLVVSQLCSIYIIREIVEQLKWTSFVYMSHSRGIFGGVLYNHLYPGKITCMIHIDPAPPLSMYYFAHSKPRVWYEYCYDSYYNTYDRWVTKDSRELTYDHAINLIAQNRGLTEEQAETILSRSLVPVNGEKFRLSFEPRMKTISTIPLSEETLFTVITEHTPPMLFIEASENKSVADGKKFAADIIAKCCSIQPGCSSITVNGGHDVHIINPEIIIPHIIEFLSGAGLPIKSKL